MKYQTSVFYLVVHTALARRVEGAQSLEDAMALAPRFMVHARDVTEAGSKISVYAVGRDWRFVGTIVPDDNQAERRHGCAFVPAGREHEDHDRVVARRLYVEGVKAPRAWYNADPAPRRLHPKEIAKYLCVSYRMALALLEL